MGDNLWGKQPVIVVTCGSGYGAGTVSDSGYFADSAGFRSDDGSDKNDAGAGIYGGTSGYRCDDFEPGYRWKSDEDMAGKTGTFFQAGIDVCGDL